ncbi:hypothetical protein PMIT1323_02329 [Prochlorococcus marinus str. MIT 1323]|nr:hypothetical protein PMIT1323_02329 [Prochlorococcus marinus str. MIT 1323]
MQGLFHPLSKQGYAKGELPLQDQSSEDWSVDKIEHLDAGYDPKCESTAALPFQGNHFQG